MSRRASRQEFSLGGRLRELAWSAAPHRSPPVPHLASASSGPGATRLQHCPWGGGEGFGPPWLQRRHRPLGSTCTLLPLPLACRRPRALICASTRAGGWGGAGGRGDSKERAEDSNSCATLQGCEKQNPKPVSRGPDKEQSEMERVAEASALGALLAALLLLRAAETLARLFVTPPRAHPGRRAAVQTRCTSSLSRQRGFRTAGRLRARRGWEACEKDPFSSVPPHVPLAPSSRGVYAESR